MSGERKDPLSAPASSPLSDIVYFDSNLVLDSTGRWWALYRLRPYTYDLASRSAKEGLVATITSVLSEIGGVRFKLMAVVSAFAADAYVGQLSNRPYEHGTTPISLSSWSSYCRRVADHLGRRGPYRKEFFLSVCLSPSSPTIARAIGDAVSRRLLTTFRALAGREYSFDPADRQAAEAAAELVGATVRPLVDTARPVTSPDIAWLIARMPYRGTGIEPAGLSDYSVGVRRGDDANMVVNRDDVRSLMRECVLAERLTSIESTVATRRVSYQRFLSISRMPLDSLAHPGDEWAYLDAPVDVLLDVDVIPASTAERQRETQLRRIREQARFVGESDEELTPDVREAYRAARSAESHSSGESRLDVYATIGIGAATPEELDELTAAVRTFYSPMNIRLSSAAGSQLNAYADFLVAGPRRRHADFRQPMPARTLAGSVPVGSAALGDGRGFYIGYPRASNGVVCYDPALPMSTSDMSGSCMIVGDLGSGKTMTYQALMYMMALAGHECLLVDPKGDSEKLENIAELRGGIHKVRIAAGSTTRLPLLTIYDTSTDAGRKSTENLLRTFLMTLLETSGSRALGAAVRKGVRRFMEVPNLSIGALVDTFSASAADANLSAAERDAFKEALSEIEYWREDSLAQVVLTDESAAEFLQPGRNSPITVMQTFGLELPSRSAMERGDALTESQRISQAVLSVAAAAATQMASSNRLSERRPFKALGFDEAWRFMANEGGATLLDSLIREGRSQNVAAFVMSQRWSDLEDLAPLLTIRFLGRNGQDDDDIARSLRATGVDPDERTLAGMKSFSPGDFIHRDLYGQVGTMHFDVCPPEILAKLASSPQPRPTEAAPRPEEATTTGSDPVVPINAGRRRKRATGGS